MDTFYSILDEEESKQIWDRINAELRFQPSVRVKDRKSTRLNSSHMA